MKDGGPAFPSTNEVRLGEYSTSGHPGMTLRQWYKGMIAQGLLSGSSYWPPEELADTAARFADAFLREDEETGK